MGQHTSKQTIEFFLEPLRDGRIDVIFEHAQLEVTNNLDREVYRSMVNSYKAFLGTLEKINDRKYERNYKVNGDDVTLTESSEIIFANGTLTWNVEWKNDKLALINIDVPNMPLATDNIEPLVAVGIKFIRHFYAREATEFCQMMSPTLAKNIPPSEVQRMLDLEVERAELGAFKDVKVREIPDLATIPTISAGKTFDIPYEIIREKAIGTGTVTFTINQFDTLLTGFTLCQSLIRWLIHPEPSEALSQTKEALQHMINLDTDEYYNLCIKSLRKHIHPEITKCYWEDMFTYLGPIEETIDDALKRCNVEVATDNYYLSKVVVSGTFKFLNSTLNYMFAWVNSALQAFDYALEERVGPFIRSPVVVPAQSYWERTKRWLLGVIQHNNIDILAEDMLPGLMSPNTPQQFLLFMERPFIRSQFAEMKALLNENWNYQNIDSVEFELISPPLTSTCRALVNGQFTFKFIVRDKVHHEYEAQVTWQVDSFRAYISAFELSRAST